MRRTLLTVMLTTAAALTLAAVPASAAYVSYDSSFGLEVSDQTGSETNSVTIADGSGSDDYVVTDAAGVTADGVDCIQDSATQATCTAATESFGYAELGDGDDTLTITGVFASFDVYGGDGSDTISAGSGNSLISGEDGQDWINPGLGTDTVTGGDETDTISYADRSTAVAIYPDGTNEDGSNTVVGTASGAAGEQDKISADIENIEGGGGDDTLYGNASANRFICLGGTDTVVGAGSLDTLDADCEINSDSSSTSTSPSTSSGDSSSSSSHGSGSSSTANPESSASSSSASRADSKLSKITVTNKTKTARLKSDHTLKLKVRCTVYSLSGTCGASGALRYRSKTLAIATDTFTERRDHYLIFTLKKKAYRQLSKAIKAAKRKHRKVILSLSLSGSAVIKSTALPAGVTSSTKLVVKL